MTVDEAFDATVAFYDDWMKKALPNYDDIFSAALALLPFKAEAALEVLDLGAGTGLFSKPCAGQISACQFRAGRPGRKNAGGGAHALRGRFGPVPVRAGRLP